MLLLTMFMGLLGSIVTMTWSFVRQDREMGARRFVVAPLVGMTTAFVVFIFISAGQLTLSADPQGSELNPFVLSFIGIISGLLSERAYARISAVGGNFFAVGAEAPRWATRLSGAMAEAGLSEADLARHLGIPPEEIHRIVTEAAPATIERQRLIAACLRRPLRELFTDAPPEKPAAPATA